VKAVYNAMFGGRTYQKHFRFVSVLMYSY